MWERMLLGITTLFCCVSMALPEQGATTPAVGTVPAKAHRQTAETAGEIAPCSPAKHLRLTRPVKHRDAYGCGVWTMERVGKLDFRHSRFNMPGCCMPADDTLPSNYDKLLTWTAENWDPSVDFAAELDELIAAVYAEPLLRPDLTEHVTRQVAIIWQESHGKRTCSGDGGHSLGMHQINDAHTRSMRKCGLSLSSEHDRKAQAQKIVLAKIAKGKTGWGCYTDWSVVTNSKAPLVKSAYAELMEGVN